MCHQTGWPKSVPTKATLAAICQIHFRVTKELHPNITGLINIVSWNTLLNNLPMHWRCFLVAYADGLKHIIYQFWLLVTTLDIVEAPDSGPSDKDQVKMLKMHLHYVDQILDDIWDEALVAKNTCNINSDWSSVHLTTGVARSVLSDSILHL
jgi:hypothetical protein